AGAVGGGPPPLPGRRGPAGRPGVRGGGLPVGWGKPARGQDGVAGGGAGPGPDPALERVSRSLGGKSCRVRRLGRNRAGRGNSSLRFSTPRDERTIPDRSAASRAGNGLNGLKPQGALLRPRVRASRRLTSPARPESAAPTRGSQQSNPRG